MHTPHTIASSQIGSSVSVPIDCSPCSSFVSIPCCCSPHSFHILTRFHLERISSLLSILFCGPASHCVFSSFPFSRLLFLRFSLIPSSSSAVPGGLANGLAEFETVASCTGTSWVCLTCGRACHSLSFHVLFHTPFVLLSLRPTPL